MAISADRSLEFAGRILRYVKKEPLRSAAVVTPAIVVLAFTFLDQLYVEPGRRTENMARATATASASQELRNDFAETGGADLTRIEGTNSFLVTVNRSSASLATSRAEIPGRVIQRVSKESGCPNVVITPADLGRPSILGTGDLPTTYSATAVCPPK